jgi:hypothetical protein
MGARNEEAHGAGTADRCRSDDRRAVRYRANGNGDLRSALPTPARLHRRAQVHERKGSNPMHTRHAVSVRTLGRWQTLRLLCRIGCADVALVLAIQFLKERLGAYWEKQ